MARRVVALIAAVAAGGCSILVGDDDGGDDGGQNDRRSCGDFSLDFNGDGNFDDRLFLPRDDASYDFDMTDFSVSLWVRPITADVGMYVHYEHPEVAVDDINAGGWALLHGGSAPSGRVQTADGACQVASSLGPLAPATWQHLSMTYKATAGTLMLFVDGQEAGMSPCEGAYRPHDDGLTIGQELDGNNPIDGRIDDLVICSPGNLADFDRHDIPCRDMGATVVADFAFEEGQGDTSASTTSPDLTVSFGISAGMDNADPQWQPGDECTGN